MLAIASLSLLSSCNTAPKNEEGRADLQDEVQTALNRFKREDTGMEKFVNDAAGYAVFPSIGKAAWIVGGAYGKGELYEKGQMTGYTDMTQASFGLQGGAQDYMELVVFETPQALSTLKDGKFELGANLSAVALKEGAASTTKFQNGVAVFTATKAGLMVEASVSGQKFRYSPTELATPTAP
jgi:lipid-binding SYLF domain-containing protein